MTGQDARSWTDMVGVPASSMDMAATAEASRAALARAEGLAESDPQRARLLVSGALGPTSQALGRGVWTSEEDALVERAAAAVAAAGPAWGGVPERAMWLTLRATRCMAVWMGMAAGSGDAAEQRSELAQLCAEADGLAEQADPAVLRTTLPAGFGGAFDAIAAGLHLQYAQALGEQAPAEEVEQALARADVYLRRLPDETADRLRMAASLLRHRSGDGDPGPEAVADLIGASALFPDAQAGLGVEYLQVVEVANRAMLSGDVGGLSTAVDRTEQVLADLATGHPLTAQLLGLLCQLLTMRAMATSSPGDLPTAIDAGVRAGRAALAARGEAEGPTVYSMGPLTNALVMASQIDLRSGPFAQAGEVFEQALARPEIAADDSDGQLRLLVTTGAGVAALLQWRSTGEEAARTRGWSRLAEAESLVVESRTPTMDWLRSAFQVLQQCLVAVSLWGDRNGAVAGLRLLPHLEQMLAENPELANEAQTLIGPGGPGGTARLPAGMPAGMLGGDVRQMLQTMRGMLQAFAPGGTPGPASGWTQGPASGSGPDRSTAEFLLGQTMSGSGPDLGAMWQQAARSSGVDPEQMRAMASMVRSNPDMRRQLEAMLGPQAAMLDVFLDLSDQASPGPTPPRPARRQPPQAPRPSATASRPDNPGGPQVRVTQEVDLSDAERLDRVRVRLDRVHDALPESSAVLDEPLADAPALDVTLAELQAALDAGIPDEQVRGQGRSLVALGRARLAWFARPGDGVAVRAALREVNVVLAAGRGETPDLERVHLLDVRARLRRRLSQAEPGQAREAVAGARSALRELAQVVLSRDGLTDRLAVAAQAGPIVARAVSWAIEDGALEDAVAVVENGRALSLAAVLLNRSMRDLAGARDSGQDRSAAGLLADVSATFDGQVALLAPSTEQVSMALASTDLHALVYLVPPSGPGERDGHALVLRSAHDGITTIPLPRAGEDQEAVLGAYRRAYRGLLTAGTPGAAPGSVVPGAWTQALDDLGAWCHDTVLGPVLDHVRTWGLSSVPHLGLIPVGPWAALPFAAAWRPDRGLPGGRRYAVHDAVLSTVPSGRAFLRAAAAIRVPVDARVLVAGETTPYGRAFARSVPTIFPDVDVLARDAVTADRILGALPSATSPGASLLHLTTHGRLEPEAAIQVADGWLPLARILDQAAELGSGHDGGTVILNACVTDVMRGADAPDAALDESLTLATGLLAAGAKHVIGTRWPVPDGATAVLAHHLHRHLARGLGPAHALRAAQLDLLDAVPGPGALEGVPPTQLTAPWTWAGYTHQGA